MIYSGNVVSLQGNTYKVMHVVYSLTCWLLPWIPVGVVLGSKSTQYRPFNMRICFPIGPGGTGFFTTTFITAVCQAVGCTCLFSVVYKLFMVIINKIFGLIRGRFTCRIAPLILRDPLVALGPREWPLPPPPLLGSKQNWNRSSSSSSVCLVLALRSID